MDSDRGTQRHVLLVGTQDDGLDRIAPILRRAGFDVHMIAPSEFVLDVVTGTSFELLIVGYPLPEMDIHELLKAVRDAGSGSRSAGVLLLSRPKFLDAAQSLVAFGANRAVSLDWAESRLWQAVDDLLSVAPRAGLGAMLCADVEIQGVRDRFLYKTVNVSSSGMLLKGLDTLAAGTRFDFAFRLPAEPRPVEGTAEIVRHTLAEREGLQGIGVRFLNLRDDALDRVQQYVRYYYA